MEDNLLWSHLSLHNSEYPPHTTVSQLHPLFKSTTNSQIIPGVFLLKSSVIFIVHSHWPQARGVQSTTNSGYYWYNCYCVRTVHLLLVYSFKRRCLLCIHKIILSIHRVIQNCHNIIIFIIITLVAILLRSI